MVSQKAFMPFKKSNELQQNTKISRTHVYISIGIYFYLNQLSPKKYRYYKLLRMIKITNIHYSRTLFDYGFINLTEGHWATSWSLGRKSWQFCQVCTFLLEKYWTYLLYIKNYLWPEGVSWTWPRFSHARSRSLSKMHKSF